MKEKKEYLAFISYSRKDEKWAEWLQNKLEFYQLPAYVREERPDLPNHLRPIFRDVTDLEPGYLSENIEKALKASRFLIVICSPNAVKSKWVDLEIQTFAHYNGESGVIPFIVEGIPHADNKEEECLPESLLRITENKEKLGANVNELSRDYAAVKLVAAMLGLRIDKLWQRYLRAEEEEKERILRERNHLQKVQSFFLAEKAIAVNKQGDSFTARLLALEALPKNLSEPDRPYVAQAEAALRMAAASEDAIIHLPKSVQHMRIAANGKWCAVALHDGRTLVYDLSSGGIIHTLQSHQPMISDIAISPDDRLIATVSVDKSLILWDVESGQMAGCILLANAGINYYHSNYLAFSPDSKLIAMQQKSQIMIWNTRTRKLKRSIPLKNESSGPIFFNGDGSKIYMASEYGVASWMTATGMKLSDKSTLFGWPFHVSPDGKKIIFTTEEEVKIWEIDPFRHYKSFPIPDIFTIRFSADGKAFSTYSLNSGSALWDMETGEQLLMVGNDLPGTCHVTLDNSRLVCEGEFCIYIRRWHQKPFITEYTDGDSYPYLSHFSPDRQQLLAYSWNISDHCAWKMIWNTADGTLVSKQKQDGYFEYENYLALSPDGSLIAYFKERPDWRENGSPDPEPGVIYGTIIVADAWNGDILHELPATADDLKNFMFSYDNQWFAASHWGRFYLWNLKSGKTKILREDMKGKNPRIEPTFFTTVSFSPDNRHIAAEGSNWDGYINLVWDIETETFREFEVEGYSIDSNIAYSPDGALMAMHFKDGIHIMDTSTLETIRKIMVEKTEHLSFSPDGRTLITDTNKGCIEVYDVATGKLLIDYQTEVLGARFSSDGHSIYTHLGQSIYLWHHPTLQELIDEQRERFSNRPFTAEEKEQYLLEEL